MPWSLLPGVATRSLGRLDRQKAAEMPEAFPPMYNILTYDIAVQTPRAGGAGIEPPSCWMGIGQSTAPACGSS